MVIAAGHLDSDIERLHADVISQINSDSKSHPCPMIEVANEIGCPLEGEFVSERQLFSEGVDSHFSLVRPTSFFPCHWASGITTNAVEEFAKIFKVKVIQKYQKYVETVVVRERDAEVTAISVRPTWSVNRWASANQGSGACAACSHSWAIAPIGLRSSS